MPLPKDPLAQLNRTARLMEELSDPGGLRRRHKHLQEMLTPAISTLSVYKAAGIAAHMEVPALGSVATEAASSALKVLQGTGTRLTGGLSMFDPTSAVTSPMRDISERLLGWQHANPVLADNVIFRGMSRQHDAIQALLDGPAARMVRDLPNFEHLVTPSLMAAAAHAALPRFAMLEMLEHESIIGRTTWADEPEEADPESAHDHAAFVAPASAEQVLLSIQTDVACVVCAARTLKEGDAFAWLSNLLIRNEILFTVCHDCRRKGAGYVPVGIQALGQALAQRIHGSTPQLVAIRGVLQGGGQGDGQPRGQLSVVPLPDPSDDKRAESVRQVCTAR